MATGETMKVSNKSGARERTKRARPASKSAPSSAKHTNGNKKRKASAEPSEPQTPETDALAQLEEAIAARRRAFEADKARVPQMRASAAALREEAATLAASRATMRKAQSIIRQADEINDLAARIESGSERAAFDARAQRYLDLARSNARREAGPLSATAALTISAADHQRRKRQCLTDIASSSADGATTATATTDEVEVAAPLDVAPSARPTVDAISVALEPTATATITTSNAALLREYRAEFEEQAPPMHIVQHDACPTCAIPLLLSVNGALLTCPECRAGYPYMDATTASMAYGDEVEFLSNNTKKAHHFEDRLKMFQGKGSKKVTKHVLDSVMEWHAEQGITSVDDITTLTVRQALKAKAFKDHYDFEMYIWCCITGKPAPTLGPTKENYCRQMFMRIQAPYAKWKARIDPTRINFLSYGYVLYKFFQLLKWTEYLPYFSLLKGRDKLEKQEAIWKGICKDVKWPFIPAPAGPPSLPRAPPPSRSGPAPAALPKSPVVVPAAAAAKPTAPPGPCHVRAPSVLIRAVAAARASRAAAPC
jgi:hypothetical protein